MIHERINNLTPTLKEQNSSTQTFGLIMIKPNALQAIIDPMITATFEGDVQPVFKQPGCDFIQDLDKVKLCGRYYRDLSTIPYGNELIDLFYGDKKSRRYFPMISEFYRGSVAFLLFGYRDNQQGLDSFLTKVKGTAETYDENEKMVTSARGIRGALIRPYRYYSNDIGDTLDNDQYKEAFSPVVQNYIHVCDTPREVATAVTHLLSQYDVNDLEQRGFPINQFIKQNT